MHHPPSNVNISININANFAPHQKDQFYGYKPQNAGPSGYYDPSQQHYYGMMPMASTAAPMYYHPHEGAGGF